MARQGKGRPARGSLLFDVWRASGRLGLALERAFGDEQLLANDFGLYSLLRFRPGLTATEVSRISGMPLTTVSQKLRRLEQRGHLVREPNPDDARSTVVRLTDDGIATHERGVAGFAEVYDGIAEHLGPDLPAVSTALRRLDGALARHTGLANDPDWPRAEVEAEDRPTLTYDGPRLTAKEEDEARQFIDFLRHRRSG